MLEPAGTCPGIAVIEIRVMARLKPGVSFPAQARSTYRGARGKAISPTDGKIIVSFMVNSWRPGTPGQRLVWRLRSSS